MRFYCKVSDRHALSLSLQLLILQALLYLSSTKSLIEGVRSATRRNWLWPRLITQLFLSYISSSSITIHPTSLKSLWLCQDYNGNTKISFSKGSWNHPRGWYLRRCLLVVEQTMPKPTSDRYFPKISWTFDDDLSEQTHWLADISYN